MLLEVAPAVSNFASRRQHVHGGAKNKKAAVTLLVLGPPLTFILHLTCTLAPPALTQRKPSSSHLERSTCTKENIEHACSALFDLLPRYYCPYKTTYYVQLLLNWNKTDTPVLATQLSDRYRAALHSSGLA